MAAVHRTDATANPMRSGRSNIEHSGRDSLSSDWTATGRWANWPIVNRLQRATFQRVHRKLLPVHSRTTESADRRRSYYSHASELVMRIANPCQVCGTGRELVYRTVKTARFVHRYFKCDNCLANGKSITYRNPILTGNNFIDTPPNSPTIEASALPQEQSK